MSFLGGPECSTGSNPLAQFQKQTAADTSLQRDRLTSRTPQQLNGFRSQHGMPEDAAFQDFAQAGPQMGEAMPQDAFHFEQLRREQMNRSGGATPNWAGEFSAQPHFAPEEFAAPPSAAFRPQDFASFRAQPQQPRTATPPYQQSAFQRPPTYGSTMMGGGFGMQRPMFPSQSQSQSQFMNQQPQAYEGKGKGRVQELSDTDWERQFEQLTTEDQAEQLDREAEEAMERELNQVDR